MHDFGENTGMKLINNKEFMAIQIKMLRLLITGALIIFLSACAPAVMKKTDDKKVVNQDSCTGADIKGNASSQKSSAIQIKCQPWGDIEVTEKYGVDPEIREQFDKAISLLSEENYPEAIMLLKAVSGQTSKFSAPHINLGIVYARTNEMKKAEESLKKALEINSRHPVAINELGLVYRKTGRYQEARELYESLLSMYPEFMPARKNLGVLCDIYTQDLSCAYEQYQAYLKNIPDDEKVKIWVADVKNRM